MNLGFFKIFKCLLIGYHVLTLCNPLAFLIQHPFGQVLRTRCILMSGLILAITEEVIAYYDCMKAWISNTSE